MDTFCETIKYRFDQAWNMAFLIDGKKTDEDTARMLDRVKRTMFERLVEDLANDVDKHIHNEVLEANRSYNDGYDGAISDVISAARRLKENNY